MTVSWEGWNRLLAESGARQKNDGVLAYAGSDRLRCPKDPEGHDPYTSVCRRCTSCALVGYVYKNGHDSMGRVVACCYPRVLRESGEADGVTVEG